MERKWYDVDLEANDDLYFVILYSVDGKRYFECEPKYGSMVPVANITVGDYPPVDYDLDEEI